MHVAHADSLMLTQPDASAARTIAWRESRSYSSQLVGSAACAPDAAPKAIARNVA